MDGWLFSISELNHYDDFLIFFFYPIPTGFAQERQFQLNPENDNFGNTVTLVSSTLSVPCDVERDSTHATQIMCYSRQGFFLSSFLFSWHVSIHWKHVLATSTADAYKIGVKQSWCSLCALQTDATWSLHNPSQRGRRSISWQRLLLWQYKFWPLQILCKFLLAATLQCHYVTYSLELYLVNLCSFLKTSTVTSFRASGGEHLQSTL